MGDYRNFLQRLAGSSTTVRPLFAKPSYVIISVTVLGVSIAALMDMVAIVDATLLRPPSARAPEELEYVRSSVPQGEVSYGDYLDIKERNTFFSGTFAYSNWSNVGLSKNGSSIAASCDVVSGTFFPTLGVRPAQGRVITEGDDVNGAGPVALISSNLADKWNLGVGSVLSIDTKPFVVIGVLPRRFEGIERNSRPDLWIPCNQVTVLSQSGGAGLLKNRGTQWLHVAGRLKPGVTPGAANSEITVIARTLQKENPRANYGMDLMLESFTKVRFSLDESARTMLLISGIVWFLFALAFVNFFALTLLRIFTRRRELAIKLAMGATKTHIARWLLGELGLVSAMSIAVGYFLSRAFLFALRLDPALGNLAKSADVEVDSRSVLIVAVCVSICALVVWILSVRNACRVDMLSAIRESSSAPRRHLVVAGLYAAQFAIALFLLATAVSFVATLREAAIRKLPFRTENLLLMDVNLNAMGMDRQRSVDFVDALLDVLRQTPGVIAAGASDSPLLTRGGWVNLLVDGRDPALETDKGFCRRSKVTDGYWEAAGIPLLHGRFLNKKDIAAQMPVAVINAAAARRFWPGQDALGRVFRQFTGSPAISVIGVVADVPESESDKVDPRIYMPSEFKLQAIPGSMTLHIAVQQDSAGTRQEIARRISPVWPYRNLPTLRSIQDQITLAAADLRTAVRLTLWVAGFATLVTGCGLYFFSAYTASQNVKDAAIRMALGANRGRVILAHLQRYRLAVLCGFGLGALLLTGSRPIFGRLNIAISSPTLACILVAAVPLMAIAVTGLCFPLRGIGRMNVHHILKSSE